MEAAERTSSDLVERVQKGDTAAWHEFGERYRRAVHEALAGRCSEQTARDVTQTVFLQILEQKAVWRRQGRFRAWLTAVARKTLASRRRRQKRHYCVGDDAPWDALLPLCGASDPVAEKVLRLAMAAFISDLLRNETPPQEYQAFELHVLQGLPYETVCPTTGLGRNEAYRTIHSMKIRFRQLAAAHAEQGPPEEYIWRAWESLNGL